MAIQKKEEFDSEDSGEGLNQRLSFGKLTIFIGVAFIFLAETFLYFLSSKTGASFGLKEIAFGLISGIVITLFLIWARFIMASNKYLGAFISLTGIIAIVYALTRKYQGIYTTVFTSIGVILALFYIIFYFVKANKK